MLKNKVLALFSLSIFLLLLIFSPIAFAQDESVTFTTYYPSPYGDYNNLTTNNFIARENVTLANQTWGKVGIGTENPSSKLDIVAPSQTVPRLSALSLVSQATAGGDKLGISFAQNNVSDRGRVGIFAVSELANGYASSLAFFTRYAEDGSTLANTDEKMRITSGGYVGIGTAMPGAKLEIRNENTGEGDYVSMKFRSGGQSNSEIRSVARSVDRSDLQFYTSTGAGAQQFVMALRQDGYVGIGTAMPGAKLDIAGNNEVFSKWSYKYDNRYHLRLEETTSVNNVAWSFIQTDYTSGFQEFNVLTFNDGNVGIGTANPVGKLDVNGAIYQRGGVLYADYVFEPDYKLESIEEHAQYMYKYKHLKAVPKVEVDEKGQQMVEIGANTKGILEELEKAHVYIQQVNERIRALEAKLSKLEVRK